MQAQALAKNSWPQWRPYFTRPPKMQILPLLYRNWRYTWPPVRIAMSCNAAFLFSPNPGAFTAANLSPPLNLFTIKVANASLSTSSAIIKSGFCVLTTFSKMGRRGASLQKTLFHTLGVFLCNHFNSCHALTQVFDRYLWIYKGAFSFKERSKSGWKKLWFQLGSTIEGRKPFKQSWKWGWLSYKIRLSVSLRSVLLIQFCLYSFSPLKTPPTSLSESVTSNAQCSIAEP